MNNPRGSRWRKWDLHIHSDCSPGKLEQIVNKIIEKGISVFSITDHSSIENIDKFLEITKRKQKKNQEIYFLPGIELKTDKGKKSVHLIGVFPLKDKDGIRIDSAYLKQNLLSKIDCSDTDIISAGREVLGKGKNQKTYRKRGLLEKTVNFETAARKIKDLGGITIVHAGTKSSGLEKEMCHAKINNPKELYNSLGHKKRGLMKNHIDVCELTNWKKANLKEKDFYLRRFGKPSIVSSDSHNLSDIGERYTWIKADPTLEGLKQIIYEPIERVKIQKLNPKDNYKKTIISSLSVNNSSEFPIPDQKVEFNRNMISVIGGRGSGKSVLLKTIAHFNCQGGEFIEDIRENEGSANFKIKLINKDGNNENIDTQLSSDDCYSLPVFYIPQNRLANEARNEETVRDSVLNHLGLTNVLVEYSDLIEQAELLHSQLVDKEIAKQDMYEELNYDSRKYKDFDVFINKKIEKEEEKKQRYSTKKIRALIEDIALILSEGQLLKQWKESGEFDEILANIKANNRLINFYNKKIDSTNKKSEVNLVKLPLLDLADMQDQNEKNKNIVEKRLEALRGSFVKKKKELKAAGIKEDITNLTGALKNIEKEISILNQYKQNHKDFNREVNSLKNSLNKLFNEDEKNSIPKRIKQTKSYINNLFTGFTQEREGSELFETIFKGVRVKGQIKFEWEKLKEYLQDCFYKDKVDIQKDIVFGSRKITQNNFVNWVATGRIWKVIDDHSKYFKEEYDRKEHLDGKNALIKLIFEKWHKFIRVIPEIEMRCKGKFKELSEMSEGELSTLLLKFKLATEGLNSQIVILDQPEDNLDNDFITNELEDLMKEIKKHKQLIVATHNANLVIGADSEEIIVAQLDQRVYKKKKYLSGSIENPRIKNKIITILEGGREAFKKRRKKLNL